MADKANRSDQHLEGGNAAKDPDEWKTGDEPMTGAQCSYLHTLASEAGEPRASGAIHTSCQAGGMTSCWMRPKVSASRMGCSSGAR